MISTAAVFDLNDILLNSKEPYVWNVHSVLRKRGLKLPSERVLVGCANLDLLKEKYILDSVRDLKERLTKI